MLLAKAARLQDAATKQWWPGVLALHPHKLSWQPSPAAPGCPSDLHIGLISITNMQRAKGKPLMRLTAGTSAHPMEFESEADRDAVVDAYTRAKEQLGVQARARSLASSESGAGPSTSSRVGSQAGGVGAAGREPSPAASTLGWSGPLPTGPQKREIMLEDPEVGERYNSLVAAAGVLSEDEFWASVMAERARSASAPAAAGSTGSRAVPKPPALAPVPGQGEQKRGLSNAMFHVPVEQDGKSVSMRFTLTPDLIAMVFAEKPHVKRSFDKNVPANMSEKEFWTRYLKHELAKEERRKKLHEQANQAASDVPMPMQGPDARLFADEDNGTQAENSNSRRVRRKVLKAADPTVNLEADQGDGFSEGFGLLHAASKEPRARGGFRAMAEELARDINRHATVVLGGSQPLQQQQQQQQQQGGGGGVQGGGAAAGGGAPSAASSMGHGKQDAEGELDELAAARLQGYGAGLEDLRAPRVQQYEELRITEPGAYFDRLGAGAGGQAAAAAAAAAGGGAVPGGGDPCSAGGDVEVKDVGKGGATSCIRLLSAVDPNNLPCPPVSSFSAYEALLDVCGLTGDGEGDAQGGRAQPIGLAQPPDLVLAPQLLTKFRTQVKMVADVARHFWSCMPADTADKREKAERLASHVDSKLWPEVDNAVAAANRMGGPQRPYVRQLLTPALRMMEALLERYKRERARGNLIAPAGSRR